MSETDREARRLEREAAEMIDTARRRAGVGKSELARRLGVPPSRVTKVLSGRANLTLATLVRFGAALGFRWDLRPDERSG